MITSLAYLGITTPKHAEWDTFATQVLGLERYGTAGDGTQRYRMDDAEMRLGILPGDRDDVTYLGWNVTERSDAEAIAAILAERDIETHLADDETAANRSVQGFIWFEDPWGFRHELVWNQAMVPSTFHPGRPMKGFKTGEQGMGHVLLMVTDMAAADEFYRSVLGFQLSDRIVQPPALDALFYHVNGRHHTLALAEAPFCGLNHLMIETVSLDDVGNAHDLVQEQQIPLVLSFGRHTNDLMTSFYVATPSQFAIEYGWGGVEVDDLWMPRTYRTASIWGHKFNPNKVEGLAPALITRAPVGAPGA